MSSSGSSSRATGAARGRKRPPPRDPAANAQTNLRPGKAPGRGARFDAAAADRACEFFSLFLTHSKGKQWAGRPLTLEPWQRDLIVRPLFGWKRRDGRRWFRRCDLWLPRKNGKSTLAAGIALYLLFADAEPAAEVYLVANSKEQAGIVFTDAKRMVQASPELRDMSQVFDSERTMSIMVPETMSVLAAVSSEPTNKDGLNISGCVFDEVHELKDFKLWEKMVTGQGARDEPLMIVISTAGYDRETVGWAEYQDDRRILAGKTQIRDRLVVIFEADPKADWKDESTWEHANPCWNTMASTRTQLKSMFAEALLKPSKEAAFKRYHLNLWTGAKTGAFDMEKWDACGGPIAPADLAGLPCWIGLDLSKRSDLTAAVRLFKRVTPGGADVYYVLPHFFVPEDGVDLKEARDGVPYREWARAGHLSLTPGNIVDYGFIADHIRNVARELQDRLKEVAYDPYNATHLATQMADEGLTVVEFPQTIKHVTLPTKELMNLVISGRLRHGDNPVLRWMASNAATVRDLNDNEKLTKKGSTSRIDGLSATVTALGRASVGETVSVYETRGVIVL